MIDEIYKLEGPAKLTKSKPNATFGEMYLQIMFKNKDDKSSEAKTPKLKIDLKKILKEEEKVKNKIVKGTMVIRIYSGKDLMAGDTGLIGSKADPYC